ncbi:hypothetical protein CERSUDRAFT_101380 [Gelatoporia subvermispora B]|uniref:Uncharacterized protein n=1 Tax=Ceriporiopsis subvermispora (strain B) TaxID=914234 RepID=M2QWY7_CERS8|nr:hypothetical protein CERSUDRAFT_101380 [Gelatoporia subvermispora B]
MAPQGFFVPTPPAVEGQEGGFSAQSVIFFGFDVEDSVRAASLPEVAEHRKGDEEDAAGQGSSGPRSRTRSRTWEGVIDMSGAINLVHAHTPLSILEAARFRNAIHLSPGVVVPRDLQHDLSVGVKYLYYQPRRKQLIMAAWEDFERRLRWRLFFSFSQWPPKPYDPDYAIEKEPTKKAPPRLPHFMENGLRRGRAYCESVIAKVPEKNR